MPTEVRLMVGIEHNIILLLSISTLSGIVSALATISREEYIVHTVSHLGVLNIFLSTLIGITSNIALSTVYYCLFIMACLNRNFSFVSMLGHIVIAVAPLIGASNLYTYNHFLLYSEAECKMYTIAIVLLSYALIVCRGSIALAFVDRKNSTHSFAAMMLHYVSMSFSAALAFDFTGPMAGFLMLIAPGAICFNLTGDMEKGIVISGLISMLSTLLILPFAIFHRYWGAFGFGTLYSLALGFLYIASVVVRDCLPNEHTQ